MPEKLKRVGQNPGAKTGVFFDDQIFHLQKAGGISRYVCALGGQLADSGELAVEIFGGISDNLHLRELPPGPRLAARFFRRRDRLRLNTLMTAISRKWRRRAFLAFKRNFGQVIYHASYYDLDPVIKAQADATVVTFHDMIPEWLFSLEPRPRAGVLPAQKRMAAAGADLILANSESTRRDVLAAYPELKLNVAVSLLASDLSAAGGDQASPFGLRPGSFFMMVGNREGYKNGEVALRAFARFARANPSLHLVMFGGRDPSDKESAILREGAVSSQAHYLKGDDRLLAAGYANALALIYPSEFEGFGLPVLEAMQSGCPVITTPCKSLPEVGGDAVLYAPARDETALIQAMSSLLENPATRAELIRRGRIRANSFSWRKTAEATLTAYRTRLSF